MESCNSKQIYLINEILNCRVQFLDSWLFNSFYVIACICQTLGMTGYLKNGLITMLAIHKRTRLNFLLFTTYHLVKILFYKYKFVCYWKIMWKKYENINNIDIETIIFVFNLVEIDCGHPGNVNNGGFLVSTKNNGSFDFNTTISYYCNAGFKLVGNVNRVCQNTSSWTGTQPVCKSMKLMISFGVYTKILIIVDWKLSDTWFLIK